MFRLILTLAILSTCSRGTAQEIVEERVFNGNRIQFIKGAITAHEPYLLNGKKVIAEYPQSDSAFHLVSSVVSPVIKEEILRMGKGSYCIDINNLLVNEYGRVVYYETEGAYPSSCTSAHRKGKPLTDDQQFQLRLAMDRALLDLMVFRVTHEGIPVPYVNRATSTDITVNE